MAQADILPIDLPSSDATSCLKRFIASFASGTDTLFELLELLMLLHLRNVFLYSKDRALPGNFVEWERLFFFSTQQKYPCEAFCLVPSMSGDVVFMSGKFFLFLVPSLTQFFNHKLLRQILAQCHHIFLSQFAQNQIFSGDISDLHLIFILYITRLI